MNWDWAASLDHIWRSPNLPLYLTLATTGFVGLVVLVTLLRSERSVANGVLALITLFVVGVAGAVALRGFSATTVAQPVEVRPVQTVSAPLPQLSCIDELAGDAVLTACEKVLFGSAESVAAAVAYAASQITLLTSLGDVATANKGAGSDLLALRRAVERDRYGLMAYVLAVRDRCTPSSCRAFRSLTETRQIAANMEERVYEGLVTRYAAAWNAPPQNGLMAALPASVPTGKPTNAEFPTSASTPAVSIMNPEPPLKPSPPAVAAPATQAPQRPPAAAAPPAPAPSPALAAAKKSSPAPKRPSSAPVQLAPSAPAAASADNDQ